MEDICQLCLKPKKLCDSHIIPEFLYKPLYDEKHTYLKVDDNPNNGTRKLQKDVREKLLCNECEGLIGKYEHYMSKYLISDNYVISDDQTAFFVNPDYKLFRLFELSIVWRASISKLPEFSFIKLGPHQEKLRIILLNSEEVDELVYPGWISELKLDREISDQLIMNPYMTKNYGHNIAVFLHGGFIWSYFISSHRPPAQFETYFHRKNQDRIAFRSNWQDIGFLKTFARDLYKQGKLGKLPIK